MVGLIAFATELGIILGTVLATARNEGLHVRSQRIEEAASNATRKPPEKSLSLVCTSLRDRAKAYSDMTSAVTHLHALHCQRRRNSGRSWDG